MTNRTLEQILKDIATLHAEEAARKQRRASLVEELTNLHRQTTEALKAVA